MKLDTEFIKLPLQLDAIRLAEEVAAVPESAWRPHPQGHAGNSALPLLAAGGDPANDATKGPMRPTPHLDRCPYLSQVLAAFETVLGRTRLMRLDGNAEATPHADTNYYWMQRVRLHVPIVTRPAVRFLCGRREVHMAAGEAWIFDTWQVHNVLNPEPTRRIHLVCDSVGSAAFWELVARGERPFSPGATAPAGPFQPRPVPFVPGAQPELRFETVNQPVVLSPWEQESLLAFFTQELEATANPAGLIAELTAELAVHRRDWRALWAAHGESPAGWPAYRALLDRLDRRLARFERRLRLANGSEAVEIVRQLIVRPALNPDLAGTQDPSPSPQSTGALGGGGQRPRGSVGAPAGGAKLEVRGPDLAGTSSDFERPPAGAPTLPHTPTFDRPILLVGSPRSGTSLLFETLARSPDLWTVGGESHAVIETIAALHPAHHGWDSNRLTAADGTPEAARELTEAFGARLRDRDRNPPPAALLADPAGLRLLEKTPKNALRVPFFAVVWPESLFVYLYRDPRETISSLLDAWRSGRFVTYPYLPGWPPPPHPAWSLLLVPGWRELAGKDLAEIAARQWAAATAQLLDDLAALPAGRWCVASYDRLVTKPQAEIARLCNFLDLAWDQELTAPLPPSRHTLTSPEPDKWRHNGELLKPVLPLVAEVAQRARDLFADPPAVRPAKRPRDRSQAQAQARPAQPQRATSAGAAADPTAFRSVYTQSLPQLLDRLGGTLLVSTYQSGRLIAVRADGASLNTHFRAFPSPMGIAVGRDVLALGTQRHVWEYRNQPEVGRKLPPPGRHDACFLPRTAHITGDIRIHELAFGTDGLWIVNTRFSCLCGLDGEHSFVPRWRPPFVSGLAPDDRCHLNGLAMVDGRPRYLTALGATDAPQGWREAKAHGGVLLDWPSGEIVARGLSMPHSPRWYQDKLWVLESGKGEIGVVDLATGKVQTVAQLPGFTRGLAFAGPYALVGLSQVRESNIFGGIPLTERVQEKLCGVWLIDTRSGQIAGFLRFEGLVQEIFDLQLLPARWPEIAEPDSDLLAGAFTLPAEALAEVVGR
jgi:uncharacterized protein (TIGR03032 family)